MKKKKACDSSNSDKGDNGDLKQKERHIVSWSEEEDDILREQIGIHGTNNWAIIASNFENKTTRQCRRRWFTYLNSDFKKGGWSQEEDMLLCEAQKIFGNRWTEIAKVVSGRTDNAVKNRFSILCKKKAKHDSSSKENNCSQINVNNKRTRQNNTDRILETSMQHTNSASSSISSKKTKMAQDDLCDGQVCPLPNSEFNSPVQVTPLFRSMAEGIPSPQFSESERSFLLKTLGMESAIPNPASRSSQSPPCKRTLLHCL
ncbi:hypothetical protein L1887_30555 [Cichorium endivia]|nr:hypothetical protein L1887_30555 [Cichorium endivia]